MMKIYISAILVFLFISGCSPLYETQYAYAKPDSPEGVACTFQCENSKLLCTQNKELQQQNCETKASINRLQYDQCVTKNGKDDCFRDFEFCNIDTRSCTTTYNQCYNSCGGSIDTKEVCVDFCK